MTNKTLYLLAGGILAGALVIYTIRKNKQGQQFGRNANSPSDCKSDERFVQVNCVMPPCPSMCLPAAIIFN